MYGAVGGSTNTRRILCIARTGFPPLERRSRLDAVPTVHVRAERLRQQDAAVRLLPVLEDRDQRPPDREPRAVERVHVRGLRALARAELDPRAASLIRLEVGARGDLAVDAL